MWNDILVFIQAPRFLETGIDLVLPQVSVSIGLASWRWREDPSKKDNSLKEGKRLARLPKGEYLPAYVCWGKQHITELVVGLLSLLRKESPVSCCIQKVN